MSHSHKSLEERITKSLSVLKEDLNTVRAGRANPALLDKVMVDYYGSPTPLKNLSNISVPDPRTLMIAPFDPKSIGDIERQLTSLTSVSPSMMERCIRLGIPQLTEERRKRTDEDNGRRWAKKPKVAVRNLRRDANDALKNKEKDGN